MVTGCDQATPRHLRPFHPILGKNDYGPGRGVVRLASQERRGCVRYSEEYGNENSS